MKANYKCSICQTTFTRKENAKRHVLNMNIHFGKGEVVAQDGQPLGNGRMHPKTRNMMVISKLWRLYWEEQIRTISREDFAQAYGILECTETSKHSLLKYAIDNYSSSPPSGSTSTLAWKLLGLDWDDVDNGRKQYVTEVRKKRDFDSIDILDMLKKDQLRESIQAAVAKALNHSLKERTPKSLI